ncbi:hypothetical protein [Duganella sp. BuS-21]|uniref:hypothetical protein n=1 Tax=Duganella sp. BuS-21 TaxID=2943848 RepID=UPI0035A5EBDC
MKKDSFADDSTHLECLRAAAFALALDCIAMVWRILLWPFALWRILVAIGAGTLRTTAKILFGLLGMVLLGNFLFGMIYVLAYPWLR